MISTEKRVIPAKIKNQLEFMLKLIKAFQEPITLKRLAESLCMDQRNVYRWIEVLTEMGFQIEKSESTNPRTYWIKGGSEKMWEIGLELMVYSDPKKR